MQSSLATSRWQPGAAVGRFRLERSIVEGVEDSVYEVSTPEDLRFALKIVPAALVDVRKWHGQIEAAQAVLGSLRLRHFPSIVGWGQEGDYLHAATELLIAPLPVSPSLDRRVLPVSSLELLRLIAEAALALHAVHEAGLVHLDIRPGRLFLCRDRTSADAPYRLCITGFGPSLRRFERLVRRAPPARFDRSDYVYLAPELKRGMAAGAKADVFALAAVTCAVMTGHPPALVGGTLGSPPEHWRPWGDLDGGQMLAARDTVLRALAGDPRQRPTAQEFARELLGAIGSTEAVAGADPVRRHTVSFPTPFAEGEPPEPGRRIDDNVQFTVYRPRAIAPARWYDLLAFAHLAERRSDAEPSESDPVAEVARQAERILGEDAARYQNVVADSGQGIPEAGQLSFVPHVPGLEFEPPVRSFRWLESVHTERFRMRAAAGVDGQTLRGRVTVLLGRIVVAEVALTVSVDRRQDRAPPARDAARPYRRIFASYSHKDASIVAEVSAYARTLGDRYLVDVTELRAGEIWGEGLERLIRQADVFQLFWSWNAMTSPYVRREWEHALSLGRPDFVRPTYWEDPMPERPGLPPQALMRLHFQKMCFPAAPARAAAQSAPMAASRSRATMASIAEDPESPPRRPRRRTLTMMASAATLVVLGAFALVQTGGQMNVYLGPPMTMAPPPPPPPPKMAQSSPPPATVEPDPSSTVPTRTNRPSRPGQRLASATIRPYDRAVRLRAHGEEREALLAFRQALNTGDLDPAERAASERAVAALERKFGEIVILGDRVGAEVRIDGRFYGRTPLGRPILLRPGRHELVVTQPGHERLRERFRVEAGEKRGIQLRLEPPMFIE